MKRNLQYSDLNKRPSHQQSSPGYYSPWIEPYFGTGVDGDLSTTGNVTYTSILDGDYVTKNYINLTVNAGHTVTVSQRCKGLVIFAENLTVNGTITMKAKGGNIIPTTVEKFPIKAIKRRNPPFDEIEIIGYEYLELGTMSANALPVYFRASNASGAYSGRSGNASIILGVGGEGGTGAAYNDNSHGALAIWAGLGSCYSGGAGGGGRANSANSFDDLDSNATMSGAGGDGFSDHDALPAGGGAGEPPGTGTATSPLGCYGLTGETGKGGSIIIICKNFYGGGLITTPGSNGGDVYVPPGIAGYGPIGLPGGAGGGGGNTLRYVNSYFTGTINAPGGTRGTTTGDIPYSYGGFGGAGYVSVEAIT